jgi:hypothetical protein
MPDRLVQKARRLADLTTLLRQYLGAPLSDHTWVGAITSDTLVLVTDGSAWVTRLRYQQHEILKLVSHETGLPLRRLRMRITPTQAKSMQTPRRRALSADAARRLEASAADIQDPDLRRALLRLAERGRRRGEPGP